MLAFIQLAAEVDAGTLGRPMEERIEILVTDHARSLCRDVKRRQKREILSGLTPDLAEMEAKGKTTDWGKLKFLSQELATFPPTFDQSIRGLEEGERDAYILTELRGLTVREAAAVLDEGKSTVQRHAEAARISIRRELDL